MLECSKDNVGSNKVYNRIIGCLIAFACQMAFRKNYRGFVSLIPKTGLIRHYRQKYGFEVYGRQLAVQTEAAAALIEKYL